MPFSDFNDEFNPIIGFMINSVNLLADIGETDDLRPSPSQYALAPGDKAVMAGSNSPMDNQLTALEVLDASEHAERWPDWEERLQKSYLLCSWVSNRVQIEEIGWFSRVKLIQLTNDQHQELSTWISDGNLPDEVPDWMREVYKDYTEHIHAASPNLIPRNAICGNCGGDRVLLQLHHHSQFTAPAGVLVEDGKEYTVHMGEGKTECTTSGRLHCSECHSSRELEEDEIRIDSEAASHFFSHPK